MGESSACLVRSLSHPSPTSQDSKEGDAIRRALTSSISFGRFMSEPLVWEKWSAFSHDRYLEDAKKYSRPGSVAEKKAYFEAHFKRIVSMKAAGSIGEQNDAVNNISESNATEEIDKEHRADKHPEESEIASAEEDQGENGAAAVVATIRNNSFEEREAATVHVKGVSSGSEDASFLEKHVESSTHIKDIHETGVDKDIISAVEEAISTVTPASPNNKISISSSKSSVPTHPHVSIVKPTVKRKTPIRTKIVDHAVAYSRKTTEVFIDKNLSAPKSVHMSIDFSSQPSDVKKTSSPLLQRIANSKFVTNLTKISKESTNQHAHTRGSMNASAKNLPAAPQPENGRTKSLLRQSVTEMITEDRKPKTSPMPSRSSTTHGIKECSPVVSPPFTLKSEERAAKRKEFFQKLEEKRKAQQAEMEKLQGKLKGKTRNVFEDRRQPLISQAKTNTSIDLAVNSSIVPAKKISTSQPCSPMIGKKQSTELSHNCRPPWKKHTLKMDSIKDGSQKKSHLPLANSNKLLPKKSTLENAPPNIWH